MPYTSGFYVDESHDVDGPGQTVIWDDVTEPELVPGSEERLLYMMQVARITDAAGTEEQRGVYIGMSPIPLAQRAREHTRDNRRSSQIGAFQSLLLSNPGTLGIGLDVEFSSTRAPLRDRVVVQTEQRERQRERRSEITAAREALEAQMEEGEITEGHYLQRMNALRDEYDAVLS